MRTMFGRVFRRLVKGTLLIGIPVALLAGIVQPAFAQGTFTFTDLYSGWCLDNHVNGAVFTDACDGDKQQQWNAALVGYSGPDGIYTLEDNYSHQCLDSHSNGAVFTDACDGDRQQEWIRVNDGLKDDYSSLCLDSHVNGAVFTDACDGDKQQVWVEGNA